MQIKYNTPIEVTADQFNQIMVGHKGICAGQQKDGKYYIKVWLMEYKNDISKIRESTNQE